MGPEVFHVEPDQQGIALAESVELGDDVQPGAQLVQWTGRMLEDVGDALRCQGFQRELVGLPRVIPAEPPQPVPPVQVSRQEARRQQDSVRSGEREWKEIGAGLEMSEAAVQMRHMRALQKLHKVLTGDNR